MISETNATTTSATENDKTETVVVCDSGSKRKKQQHSPMQDSGRKWRKLTVILGDSMKMTMCTAPTMVPRIQARRPGRPPSGKRLAMARNFPGKVRSTTRRSLDPCDNSNDSGLGFDHHMDPHAMGIAERLHWSDERAEAKRPRIDVKMESEDGSNRRGDHHMMGLAERLHWSGENVKGKRSSIDVKLENEEANENYGFPENISACKENMTLIRTAPSSTVPSLSISNGQSTSSVRAMPSCLPLVNRNAPASPITLTTQLSNTSKYGDITLSIICQPEQQHRARYQTEGSRGAVKDRSGNGFPMVKLLNGYNKAVTLQVFIGTDMGKVTPHMFYQACRVSGKNSTPCTERKIDGTIVIELIMDPAKDMTATCDCVGILKERNVDVEHRFPDQQGSRSKKKSTRCRMVFRATITHDDGIQETLQVCSHPIVCTQPPGIPEICKKSLTSCPATGGLELFVLGKNFLKDTEVHFQYMEDDHVRWDQSVAPDKEYLQQTHFVCVIPPYMQPNITEPVTVRLYVVSSGKTSEAQQFVYTPVNGAVPSVRLDATPNIQTQTPPANNAPFLDGMMWQLSKQEQDVGMMPPPGTNLVPLSQRRSSTNVMTGSDPHVMTGSDPHSPPLRTMKQELMDENSQNSILDPSELRSTRYRHISESSLDVHQGDSNMSMINENSMDIMRQNGNINENSNLSLVNENSVEMMVRRNSLSGRPVPICESSLDVNVSNSNMSMNDDSTCSSTVHHLTAGNRVFSQGLLGAVHSDIPTPSTEDLKVMDLRMKLPMATVADLVNTTAPSMATLQSLGVTEASNVPLPAQSAHSVESFLTNLETHKMMQNRGLINQILKTDQNIYAQKLSQVLPVQSHIPCPVVSDRALNNAHQADVLSMVAKSEAAAIGEQLNEQTITTTIATTMESSVLPSTISPEKLDAIINSAADTHMQQTQNKLTRSPSNSNMLLTSQDVMLTAQSPLIVPPVINTNLPMSTLPQAASATSPNISPDIILNSQISPTLMCRNSNTMTPENLLPGNLTTLCHPAQAVENPLMAPHAVQTNITLLPPATQASPHLSPTAQQTHIPPDQLNPIQRPTTMGNPLTTMGVSEPEKAIIFNATVDLLETQKKLTNILTTQNMAPQPIMQIQSENSFIAQYPTTTDTNVTAALTPKEKDFQTTQDKKNEDRMIPQSLATMSENELMNIINPSCFDQV
ncbi:Rel homology dimerization domain [Popillia japonica]|uniref:Nuclear factor of activated T-cells 5 n=1 Tax=Popillia japonica TaxID=7064 RepID=A0AAW1IDA1_POPJA